MPPALLRRTVAAMSFAEDLGFVVDLVRSAAPVALGHYGRAERLTKTHAAARDEAVTLADRAVQAHLVDGLRTRFPGDGIIGEEDESGAGITVDCPHPLGRNWVIDPIDGTNNFVAGLGHWAICVGLLERGEPVLGVVYEPLGDAMYAAARGHGATLNGRAIAAPGSALSAASIVMLTSNAIDAHGRSPGWLAAFLGQTRWKIRVLGSAAVEAVTVAAGVAHAAITVNGKLWDCVAPAAIVLEAGGLISDLTGRPIFPFDLAGYDGAKVPYLSAAQSAQVDILQWLRSNP